MTGTSRGLIMIVILWPAVAGAQAPTRSFEDLQQVLKPGAQVIVTDIAGRDTKGKVTVLSPSSLALLATEPRTFGRERQSGAPTACLTGCWSGRPSVQVCSPSAPL